MVDYHVHTTFSDGEKTPEEVINLAVSLGIEKLAIT
ncbi:MAG TPA: PHP domain-containing protein, partial [Lachnoclostridium sp.]|nr:PHP domain-containing protein [Lachnoclostridium sp.]